jgi:flagellar motor switch/type III secretory pathway protein FliN
MMVTTRPYRLCDTTEVASLRDRVASALRPWAEAWLGVDTAAIVVVEVSVLSRERWTDADAEHGTWRRSEGPAGTAWLPPTMAQPIAKMLFGSTSHHAASLSNRLADEAGDALAAALSGSTAGARPAPAPDHLRDLGRAVVQVRVGCGITRLELLLELPDEQPPATGTHAPLASMARGLASHDVTVHATLGDVEVDLETLSQLRVGDVLRLDKRVDQGVDLTVAGLPLRCEGYLVTADGTVAVELTRSTPA